jgi:hypothetical protein
MLDRSPDDPINALVDIKAPGYSENVADERRQRLLTKDHSVQ